MNTDRPIANPRHSAGDRAFLIGLCILGGSYVLLLVLMLAADLIGTDYGAVWERLASREIRYATVLSLVSCSLSAIVAVWIAVPVGYVMSRYAFPGKALLDTLLDIPIVLPPLVIGLFLLMLFNWPPFDLLSDHVVFEIPAVVLAQCAVATAFAIRTMRVSFEQIPQRYEQVAMTLGCSRQQAFWRITLPQARTGIIAAFTLAWARSLGEFGPILVFAGTTRMRTEVLPSSFYLEMQAGDLQGMLAVTLIMIVASVAVLLTARLLGVRRFF